MKYKLIQRINPRDPKAPKKWYASAVNQGVIRKTQISREIAGRSSLTRGDISNVIDNLIDELPKYLKAGNSVRLGEFGSFRLTLSGKGVDKEEEYNVSHIEKAKVVFTPGPALKQALTNIKFEHDKK